MNDRANQYQEIVLKAMAFIEANAGQLTSIAAIVKNSGYSERHVENAFRQVLNQSIVGALQAARIRKAQALLLQTNLGITNIAFESGFGNYVNFAKVFRSKTGLTPTAFRIRSLQMKEVALSEPATAGPERTEEWYKDSFAGPGLGENWKPVRGEWHNENGCLAGPGAIGFIAFQRPLPENCRISFEVNLELFPDLGFPNFAISFVDETQTIAYCGFTVATGEKATGELQHLRYGAQWDTALRIKEGEWHSLSLELSDDVLRFFIDQQEVCSFRDPFPPAYANRCYFQLGCWHCNARVRKFAVRNLGFVPVSHPIRQGDTLYNAGLLEKAMEFYIRYMESGSANDAETMELRYKIGVCCLGQKAFSTAQNWINKVVALREDKFWAGQARLSLLDLYGKTMDVQSLLEHLGFCMADVETRDAARGHLLQTFHDFAGRGFYPEALLLLQKWHLLEKQNDYVKAIAQAMLAEHLQAMRQFPEAENFLQELTKASSVWEVLLGSQVNRMQLYHEMGRIAESEQLREEIECNTLDTHFLARCRIQQGLNLRAQEKFAEALEILRNIPGHDELKAEFMGHAHVHQAFILCCMARMEEGREALADARVLDPGRRIGSREFLPFFLAEGNYAAAAESLLAEYRSSRDPVSLAAELGIKAGILHELAGMDAEAKSIFKEVSQRFPNEQVRFFGPMAEALYSNSSEFDFTAMPYEAHRRSEVFYLLGLLWEKRGDKEEARRYFELSVKEDPPLRWPAWFARQMLSR